MIQRTRYAAWAIAAAFVAAIGQGDLRAQDPQPPAGLEVGQRLPGTFHPLNINGKYGIKRHKDGSLAQMPQTHSLVAEYGIGPVVMVLAREAKALKDPGLAKLLTALDQTIEKDRAGGSSLLNAFAVFYSPDAFSPGLREEKAKDIDSVKLAEAWRKRRELLRRLEDYAKAFKHVVISTYPEPGPTGYPLPKSADVLVIVYDRLHVARRYAFPAGKIGAAEIAGIVRDVERIVAARGE